MPIAQLHSAMPSSLSDTACLPVHVRRCSHTEGGDPEDSPTAAAAAGGGGGGGGSGAKPQPAPHRTQGRTCCLLGSSDRDGEHVSLDPLILSSAARHNPRVVVVVRAVMVAMAAAMVVVWRWSVC